jgi:hypothetical protein
MEILSDGDTAVRESAAPTGSAAAERRVQVLTGSRAEHRAELGYDPTG